MRPLDQPSVKAEHSLRIRRKTSLAEVLHRGPSLARRPTGYFAEDFAIESFLICRNDACFLRRDALFYKRDFAFQNFNP
jgi:hypothetical protein